jgi:Flp pilus assembly protein TadB
MVLIPFSFMPPKALVKFSSLFMKRAAFFEKLMPYLQLDLDRADMKISTRKFLAMCITSNVFMFVFLAIVLTLFMLKIGNGIYGVLMAIVIVLGVFFMQVSYPKVLAGKRIRRLNSDLLAALRAVMIQLNSSVPLFEALVIISNQEFGEVSHEFRTVVKEINAGTPQIRALESMALKNPSPYFRRTIWQIINGMKEGASINDILKNVIKNLTKEQIIQIEKYGSELNPLAMFYMMGAVIMPTLGITFLIIIISFIQIEESLVKLLFYSLLGFVVFFQTMFSGIVKTKRPTLLGD